MTVDARGNLYLTWTQFGQEKDTDACASNVLFSMSRNGKKWSDPVVLSQVPGNCLNDGGTAAGAIPRLLDMGAEPFLLASALLLVVSQRLV